MEASTLNDILRNFAFFIDSAVYGLISLLYKLIIYLANVNVINTDNSLTLSNLISRVYILVGIFMLFKLSFSVIRYIVDPDSFTDKAKGFTSIVKRVIIAVLLLVMVPLIFDKMYYFQELVLKNNVIPNLILGTDESRVDDLESAANDVAFLLFGSFFTINENSYSLSACKPTEEFPLANIIGTKDMVLVNDGACFNAFSDALESDELNSYDLSLTDFFKTAASDDENARDVVDERRFDAFGALVAWHDSNYYGISYHAVVTTLCGGYLVFLLLSFCIDIAARAIKLMFMQILSPIAIISSVDPASSSQDDRLKEWGKECLKIYISLFIRLAVVYFTVILVKVITETVTSSTLYYENFGANDSMNSIVYIFLILGAFQVAKKLPELLEKALGIKFSGELSLNPFKSLGGNAAFMGLTGGLAGLAAGGIAGFGSAFTTAKSLDKSVPRSLVSATGGLITGGITGAFRGGKAQGVKGFSSGLQSGGRIARRMEVREATGGLWGMPGMMVDRARNVMGASTSYEVMENRAKRFDDVKTIADKMKERATSELSKKNDGWKAVQASRLALETDMREGKIDAQTYVSWSNRLHDEEEKLIKEYIDNSANGTNTDAQIEAYRSSLDKAIKDSKVKIKDKNGNVIISDYDLTDGAIDSYGNKVSGWDIISGYEDANGNKVSGFSKASETSAIEIRGDKKYNDAKDRHEGIHSAMKDAHQKH